MIDWNDCTPLTREEFDTLIGPAIPHLQDMEWKNDWDFFVNDISIAWFCSDFLNRAIELNDYLEYQKYNTKVQDVSTMCQLLATADWSEEEAALREHRAPAIWEMILSKVKLVADAVLQ